MSKERINEGVQGKGEDQIGVERIGSRCFARFRSKYTGGYKVSMG